MHNVLNEALFDALECDVMLFWGSSKAVSPVAHGALLSVIALFHPKGEFVVRDSRFWGLCEGGQNQRAGG